MALPDFIHESILDKFGIQVKKLPPIFHDKELVGFVSEFVRDAKTHGVIIPIETRNMLRVIKYVDKLSVGAAPGPSTYPRRNRSSLGHGQARGDLDAPRRSAGTWRSRTRANGHNKSPSRTT